MIKTNSRRHPVIQLHMIPKKLMKYMFGASCYYICGLFIDTGIESEGKVLLKLCKNELLPGLIVNTHHHVDHIGNNFLLQKEFNVEVYSHPAALHYISNTNYILNSKFGKKYFRGCPSSQALVIPREFPFQGYEFEVIETPGHSKDHICIFEKKNGWLFCGDLFTTERSNVLLGFENIYEIYHSLKKLLNYEISIMFTGNGKVIESPRQAIASRIKFLYDIGNRILSLHNRSFSSVEIMEVIFKRRSSIYDRLTFGELTTINFIESFIKWRDYSSF
jgi:glyoxylase-like metal-dependent hydrolase (beta-lactamase superfamily II)